MQKGMFQGFLASGIVPSLLVPGHVAGGTPAGRGDSTTFVCRELLGRPTESSVALNLCADRDLEMYVEYGARPSVYGGQTPVQRIQAGIPATITISPLMSNLRYFYRVHYRTIGATEYVAREEHSFHTARSRGRAFVFAIEADPHLDTATSPDLYRRTLANILAGNPDFLIDLGDTFMSDKLPVINQQEITSWHLLLRSFFQK